VAGGELTCVRVRCERARTSVTHGGKRLRIPGVARAHGRRAVARASARVRDARRRSGGTGSVEVRLAATRSGPATSARLSTRRLHRRCRGATPPMIRIGSIVLRSDDLQRQTEFWKRARLRPPGGRERRFVLLRRETASAESLSRPGSLDLANPSARASRFVRRGSGGRGRALARVALGDRGPLGQRDRRTRTTSSSPIRKATGSACRRRLSVSSSSGACACSSAHVRAVATGAGRAGRTRRSSERTRAIGQCT